MSNDLEIADIVDLIKILLQFIISLQEFLGAFFPGE